MSQKSSLPQVIQFVSEALMPDTVAALLLIELGLGPEEAIRQVRQARKGAIETREQESYVRWAGPAPNEKIAVRNGS